jgi:hypothetical protein
MKDKINISNTGNLQLRRSGLQHEKEFLFYTQGRLPKYLHTVFACTGMKNKMDFSCTGNLL